MSLSNMVHPNAGYGATIVDFLVDVMNGELAGFKPCHRLSAARLLIIYGREDATAFISDHSSSDLFSQPATRRSLKAAGVNPDVARLIKSETADGRRIIDFLVAVMEGRVDKVRPCHRMAAATDLLERGFGKNPRRSLPRRPRPTQPTSNGWYRYDYGHDASSGAILNDLISRATGNPDASDTDTDHRSTVPANPAPDQPVQHEPEPRGHESEVADRPSPEERDAEMPATHENNTNAPHENVARSDGTLDVTPGFDPKPFHY